MEVTLHILVRCFISEGLGLIGIAYVHHKYDTLSSMYFLAFKCAITFLFVFLLYNFNFFQLIVILYFICKYFGIVYCFIVSYIILVSCVTLSFDKCSASLL